MKPELIKQYRNCELWSSFTEQDSGGVIPYFTITDVGVSDDKAGTDYLWLPAIWLSGKSIEECRAKISEAGHGKIMCQVLWAS